MSDILALQQRRQQIVDKNLLKANAKRISHDYRQGDQVMKKQVLGLSDKLKPQFTGPHTIEQVHTNGTLTIRLNPNVTERINIRRVKPFHPRPQET